ncbi:hypothetical protein [Methanoculleus chikugoensis]|uniref:hypothetical protein n=1 Tax=Methanoculleus chikugoensis TaxID=118126 RepID=UPI000A970C6D|nr:hypothetical protein [Methanoculleus chikugoensis]
MVSDTGPDLNDVLIREGGIADTISLIVHPVIVGEGEKKLFGRAGGADGARTPEGRADGAGGDDTSGLRREEVRGGRPSLPPCSGKPGEKHPPEDADYQAERPGAELRRCRSDEVVRCRREVRHERDAEERGGWPPYRFRLSWISDQEWDVASVFCRPVGRG